MPPTVADIGLIRKQVLEALLAMPRASRYSDAIGENATYAVLQEITDKILIVDGTICSDICHAPGHPYANKFMTLSAAFSSGAKVTEHIGVYGDVLVALDAGLTFQPSIAVNSREEILRMIDNATLYGGPSCNHFIEQNFIYHAGYQVAPAAKVYYPVFTKTAACQAPENYTDVLIYGTIDLCEKIDEADPFFEKNAKLYQMTRGMVKSGAEVIPTQQQLEQMLAKKAA